MLHATRTRSVLCKTPYLPAGHQFVPGTVVDTAALPNLAERIRLQLRRNALRTLRLACPVA